MLKAPLLLLSVLVSIGIAYSLGIWVVLALFGLSFATLLFSTGDDPYDDPGMETGHCGLMTDFR